MRIMPAGKPQITRKDLIAKLKGTFPQFKESDIYWVGIRGYYKQTMGDPGLNDRAIYDDAIFIVTKDEFIAYNGNCDPRIFSPGIANLKPGIWPVYRFDKHRGAYIALCQRSGPVTVKRDGRSDDTGMFGINIHRGGSFGTGSAGCQTIPPSQWEDFITTSMKLAKKY